MQILHHTHSLICMQGRLFCEWWCAHAQVLHGAVAHGPALRIRRVPFVLVQPLNPTPQSPLHISSVLWPLLHLLSDASKALDLVYFLMEAVRTVPVLRLLLPLFY